MDEFVDDLGGLAETVERQLAADELDSERVVQLRTVEPLLEVLDWDVRSSEVRPAARLDGRQFTYLLAIDGSPAVAVATRTPGEPLGDDVVSALEAVTRDGAVSWGLATNGRTVALVTATDGEVHGHSFAFTDLGEHADALSHYRRGAVADRLTAESDERSAAAERLAANRDAVVASMTAEVVSVTDDDVESVVEAECDRAVDAVLDALRSPVDGEQEAPERAPAASPATDDAESVSNAVQVDDASEQVDPGDGGAVLESTHDSEYVARFFGGANSVGAVGTARPGTTVVGVVRYLFENHDLRSTIALPWSGPLDDVVVAGAARGSDWATLESTGDASVSVRRIDDPSAAQAVVRALADAAGLRVMFQGDW